MVVMGGALEGRFVAHDEICRLIRRGLGCLAQPLEMRLDAAGMEHFLGEGDNERVAAVDLALAMAASAHQNIAGW